MALAYFVDNPDGLAKAFAAHDEYMAIFTYFFRGKTKDCKPLSPDVDECYMSPYCFMPKHYNDHGYSNNNKHQQSSDSHLQYQHRARGEQPRQHGGFLIFVAQVPWLESYLPISSPSNNNYKIYKEDLDRRGPHQEAMKWIKHNSKSTTPILGSVEEFQDKLGLIDEEMFTFTKDGCYPTEWDVSQSLEDRAVEVTCDAMGWEVPKYWREVRQKIVDLHGVPNLDLAVWDKNHHQRLHKRRRRRGLSLGSGCNNDDVNGHEKNNGSTVEEYHGTSTAHSIVMTITASATDEADKCCYDRQEEKKECSTEEHQCRA